MFGQSTFDIDVNYMLKPFLVIFETFKDFKIPTLTSKLNCVKVWNTPWTLLTKLRLKKLCEWKRKNLPRRSLWLLVGQPNHKWVNQCKKSRSIVNEILYNYVYERYLWKGLVRSYCWIWLAQSCSDSCVLTIFFRIDYYVIWDCQHQSISGSGSQVHVWITWRFHEFIFF